MMGGFNPMTVAKGFSNYEKAVLETVLVGRPIGFIPKRLFEQKFVELAIYTAPHEDCVMPCWRSTQRGRLVYDAIRRAQIAKTEADAALLQKA